MGSRQWTVDMTGQEDMKIMKIMKIMILLTMLVSTSLARSAGQTQQYFGASNPAPCCRSKFPEEFGSCQLAEHCSQATAPYCSAFGYCTQIQRYGYDGCVSCHHYPSQTPYSKLKPIQLIY